MPLKSETIEEARARMLELSQREREGSSEIATGQAHEQFVTDQQELAQQQIERLDPLDQIEDQRRSVMERPLDADEGQQAEEQQTRRTSRRRSEASE